MIKKVGDEYEVLSESGKHLGSYKTKQAAQHRLQQIEMFQSMHRDEDGNR